MLGEEKDYPKLKKKLVSTFQKRWSSMKCSLQQHNKLTSLLTFFQDFPFRAKRQTEKMLMLDLRSLVGTAQNGTPNLVYDVDTLIA